MYYDWLLEVKACSHSYRIPMVDRVHVTQAFGKHKQARLYLPDVQARASTLLPIHFQLDLRVL